MSNILLIGNGAREHAIAEAVVRSMKNPVLFAYMKANNPGIAHLSKGVRLGGYGDMAAILDFARANETAFAIVGPKTP